MNNYDSFHQLEKKGHYFNYYHWIDETALALTPTSEQLSPLLDDNVEIFLHSRSLKRASFLFLLIWLSCCDRGLVGVRRPENSKRSPES